MINDKLISLEETATLLGVSKNSMRRYPEDLLPVIRTGGGHRRYKESDVLKVLKIKKETNAESVAVYARVSSQDQKQKGDLERQKGRLLEYASNKKYDVKFIIDEVGSGMNDKRSKLHKLFDIINTRQINKVVIEHRDRLTRFNFSIYSEYFKSHGVEIEWMEDVLNKSFEDELVEDMLSLMSSFSAKIYGKRSHQNKKKEEEKTKAK